MEMMNSSGKYPMAIEDLSDDEKEDYYIKDSDALIVAGKIVILHLLRKSSTQVFKFTFSNTKETICLSTIRSCFQLFP